MRNRVDGGSSQIREMGSRAPWLHDSSTRLGSSSETAGVGRRPKNCRGNDRLTPRHLLEVIGQKLFAKRYDWLGWSQLCVATHGCASPTLHYRLLAEIKSVGRTVVSASIVRTASVSITAARPGTRRPRSARHRQASGFCDVLSLHRDCTLRRFRDRPPTQSKR